MNADTSLQEDLHAHGLRLTRQRQAILDVLRQSEGHLDAEALHDCVKARDLHIGLATVYRTLALFKKFGLVVEHRLGEEHGHFEAVPEAPHYHFICSRCRKVIEFKAPAVERVIQELAEKEGVVVTDVHLLLSGYCAACSQDNMEDNNEI
ncbi:MAG: transcriptional repressor [Anaerolineales bacterium]|nr:transcriptional repressor [Anaerolineales bacterium]